MTTQALIFLNRNSSFLQVTRTTMFARMSLNFRQIPSPIMELAAIERLKN